VETCGLVWASLQHTILPRRWRGWSSPLEGFSIAPTARGPFSFWAEAILELSVTHIPHAGGIGNQPNYVQGYHRDFFVRLENGQGRKGVERRRVAAGSVRSRQPPGTGSPRFFCRAMAMVSEHSFFATCRRARVLHIRGPPNTDWLFHCELSVDFLIYAAGKAKTKPHRKYCLCTRTIFKPPFSGQRPSSHLP